MRIEIYKAADGWRWRLKAANHRIVAESGEAYVGRREVLRAVNRVFWGIGSVTDGGLDITVREVAR
jgi:uncharacterized protein YegP (UPF0339 family)